MNLIKQALKVMEQEFKEATEKFSTSESVKNYCRLQLGSELDEVFAVMFLDNQNRLISFEKMFRGTVNESNVYIRPIVRKMLDLNASKIILTHNHPSGNCTPSEADKEVTERFSKLLIQLDCRVLDHIIVSATGAIAFSELGLI